MNQLTISAMTSAMATSVSPDRTRGPEAGAPRGDTGTPTREEETEGGRASCSLESARARAGIPGPPPERKRLKVAELAAAWNQRERERGYRDPHPAMCEGSISGSATSQVFSSYCGDSGTPTPLSPGGRREGRGGGGEGGWRCGGGGKENHHSVGRGKESHH